MDEETYDLLWKTLNLVALAALPIFMGFAGYLAKKYADAHRGTMLGQLAYYIALGIQQKYGNTIPNEEKKAIAEQATTDKTLRKDLLIEAGVAQVKAGSPKSTMPQEQGIRP